jgi:hypothetical protein
MQSTNLQRYSVAKVSNEQPSISCNAKRSKHFSAHTFVFSCLKAWMNETLRLSTL